MCRFLSGLLTVSMGISISIAGIGVWDLYEMWRNGICDMGFMGNLGL